MWLCVCVCVCGSVSTNTTTTSFRPPCRQPRPGNRQPARQGRPSRSPRSIYASCQATSRRASRTIDLWQRRNVVRWVSLVSGTTWTHRDKSAGCSYVFVVVMRSIREAHVDAMPRERTHGHVMGEGGILIRARIIIAAKKVLKHKDSCRKRKTPAYHRVCAVFGKPASAHLTGACSRNLNSKSRVTVQHHWHGAPTGTP
jgi:hypothetical protein